MDESVCLRWDEFPINLRAFPIPFTQPNEQKKIHEVEKRWPKTKQNELRKNKSNKRRAYHELQMIDITFDAHSAFIAPTHRKRLRALYMCNWTMVMGCFRPCQNEKKQKWGGGAFNGICNPTQDAEWCLV